MSVRSKAAPRGGESEHRDSNEKNSTAPVVIPKRSTDKQKRRKKKRVSLDHPLNVHDRGIQIRLQRRQRHVHNRAVDKCHTGSKGCGDKHPAPGSFRTGGACETRVNYALVTGFVDRRKHESPPN